MMQGKEEPQRASKTCSSWRIEIYLNRLPVHQWITSVTASTVLAVSGMREADEGEWDISEKAFGSLLAVKARIQVSMR